YIALPGEHSPMTAHVTPPNIAVAATTALTNAPYHLPSVTPQARPQLTGGVLDQRTALNLMNTWFFVSERDGEASVYRIEDDGTLTHLAIQDFQLLLANIFVDVGKKHETIYRYWLHHSKRRTCKRIVFEPSGNVAADEYNLWRGFAINPKAGY